MRFKDLQVGDFFKVSGKPPTYEKVGGVSAEGIGVFDNPFDIGGSCEVKRMTNDEFALIIKNQTEAARTTPGNFKCPECQSFDYLLLAIHEESKKHEQVRCQTCWHTGTYKDFDYENNQV